MIIKRTSTIKCDYCNITFELNHDLEYECDSGYAFNKALDDACWHQPFDRSKGYLHCCPKCSIESFLNEYLSDDKFQLFINILNKLYKCSLFNNIFELIFKKINTTKSDLQRSQLISVIGHLPISDLNIDSLFVFFNEAVNFNSPAVHYGIIDCIGNLIKNKRLKPQIHSRNVLEIISTLQQNPDLVPAVRNAIHEFSIHEMVSDNWIF